jgi:hypothetical protein
MTFRAIITVERQRSLDGVGEWTPSFTYDDLSFLLEQDGESVARVVVFVLYMQSIDNLSQCVHRHNQDFFR